MGGTSELRNLAAALGEMMSRQKADQERAVRAIRWGDSVPTVVSAAEQLPAAETLALAFDDLIGRPAVAREASEFLAYSVRNLRSGAVVVAFWNAESEVHSAVQSALERNAQVLLIAPPTVAGLLPDAKLFPAPETPPSSEGLATAGVEHSLAVGAGLFAARFLKGSLPALNRIEREWESLADDIDRLAAQLPGAVRAFAAQAHLPPIAAITGGGYYGLAAARAAVLLARAGRRPVAGGGLGAFRQEQVPGLGQGATVLAFSGAHARLRKSVPPLAQAAASRGAAVIAVTDVNDHDLIAAAKFTLLLPDLAELPASILALAAGACAGLELGALNPPQKSPAGGGLGPAVENK